MKDKKFYPESPKRSPCISGNTGWNLTPRSVASFSLTNLHAALYHRIENKQTSMTGHDRWWSGLCPHRPVELVRISLKILLCILGRSFAKVAPERFAEVFGVVEACMESYFGDAEFVLFQKHLGFFQSYGSDQVNDG